MPRRFWIVWFSGLMLLAKSGESLAESVSLRGWEATARLGTGPAGRGTFRLIARSDWRPDAPREVGRYSVRLTRGDGRTTVSDLAHEDAPPSRRLHLELPAAEIRNVRPVDFSLRLEVLDKSTGAVVGGPLVATIAQFPHGRPEPGTVLNTRPFGWGEPLAVDGKAHPLPRPGPDGLSFVRVPGLGDMPGFFIAASEASNRQVASRLPGYDPRAGRSDEFNLEDTDQPAVGLTVERAGAYLDALGKADASGMSYRLPTRDEWIRAARAGRKTAFWWGDEPAYSSGANLLGPEPALAIDSTAPVAGTRARHSFAPNPWGLFHTFGNVEEWAAYPEGKFARMGGHFRTEPVAKPDEPVFDRKDEVGDDAYVGVRPALDATAARVEGLAKTLLSGRPGLERVTARFDPDRAMLTLNGTVADASMRRAADALMGRLWFVAALDDRIEAPAVGPRHLAALTPIVGPMTRRTGGGRPYFQVAVPARWVDPLPAEGSDWYVNLDVGGVASSHRLVETRPGTRGVTLLLDRQALASIPSGGAFDVSAWLSLGAPAVKPDEASVVSNRVVVRPRKP
ncbi:SUMF1/EgtB/PvdO family nonheme iron enzyme [Isosphaeraceae bacterium EP7]